MSKHLEMYCAYCNKKLEDPSYITYELSSSSFVPFCSNKCKFVWVLSDKKKTIIWFRIKIPSKEVV